MYDQSDEARAAKAQRLSKDEDLKGMTPTALVQEILKLRAAIRLHRDASGHQACWHVPELWNTLPESIYVTPKPEVPPTPEFNTKCREYRLSLDRQVAAPPPSRLCSHCKGAGSDPKDGRCPECRPYCDRCRTRWSRHDSDDCPNCAPTFPPLKERTPLRTEEVTFVAAMRTVIDRGIHYGRLIQLITWEWMHREPTEALLPSAFEPAAPLALKGKR